MNLIEVLRPVSFGQRVAEEEGDNLANYFVETDDWRRLLSDDVDIIYGPKGSGKSALYSLLITKKTELFDKNILLSPGENPSGTPVFKDLTIDPPMSEREFIGLWKLYIVFLVTNMLVDYGLQSSDLKSIINTLEDIGLRTRTFNLQRALKTAASYVKCYFRPSGIEGGIKLAPNSGIPVGVTAKIMFTEPSASEAEQGYLSVNDLLSRLDTILREADYRIWILLDRLDVAFIENANLEENALRALFHVYLDMLGYKNIRLKIFLRSDIWNKITTNGFREASHITRALTIEWNEASLLNLIIRRAAKNDTILEYYEKTKEIVLATSKSQEEFFYTMFPEQVEAGERKTTTFKWILGRTSDGSKQPAPREIIHLLNELRNVQVRHLECGDATPDDKKLFTRSVFKEALPEVSRVRLNQTLYAEYPKSKDLIKGLV